MAKMPRPETIELSGKPIQIRKISFQSKNSSSILLVMCYHYWRAEVSAVDVDSAYVLSDLVT